MAKPKFNLVAIPTFKFKVSIPVSGGKSVDVEFVYKHRTRAQFVEFVDTLGDREDVSVIMDIASGWDLEDAFSAESLELMTQNYMGSARAIIQTYINELSDVRVKN